MSESKKIFELIPKVMEDVGAIGKSGENKHDNYKFRSIDDVYNKLQPALWKNGVFFAPQVLESKEEKLTSAKGNPQLRVKLRVKYTVFASDGSSFETIVEGEAIDRGDKATNKALTAAFKYMLIQIFCIAVKDMDDADKESPEIGKEHDPLIQRPVDVGSVLVPFGKYKGKALKEIPSDELQNYCNYIEDKARKDNKPIVGVVADFMNAASYYLYPDMPPSMKDDFPE